MPPLPARSELCPAGGPPPRGPEAPHHSRGPTLDAVYVVAALVLTAVKVLWTPIVPNDFWWHLAMGRLILRDGRIPTVDAFSFTRAGEPYFNQSWLAQVWLYALHQVGGLPLIVAVHALLVASAYGLLLWLAIKRTGRTRLAVAVLLLAVEPISYDNWLVRPQTCALPLFAATLAVLCGFRWGWWNRLWVLVPLIGVWANLHGSFILGLALIGATVAGEAVGRWRRFPDALSQRDWRRLAVWFAAACLATLLNPRGPGVFAYVRHLVSAPTVTRMVTEWQSPTPHDVSGALFFLFVIALFLMWVYGPRRPAATEMAPILIFLWLALSAGRSVIWFAMVAFVPLTEALSAWLQPTKHSQGIPALNGVLIAGLVAGLVLASPSVRGPLKVGPPLLSPETPVGAVRRLQSLPASIRPRRLFHSLAAGSYLIFAAPEQPVFVDPRIELYTAQHLRDYQLLSNGYEVAALLARYRIDGLLLDPAGQAALIRRIRRDWRWRIIYRDSAGVLALPARRARAS